MDAFSKALQADKREIVIAPTIYKFDLLSILFVIRKLGL